MKKNMTLLAGALAFVLLLGGAYLLYDKLSRESAPDQLMVQSGPPSRETASPEQPPETGSPEPPPETAGPKQPPETANPERPPETGSPKQPPETASPEPPPATAGPEQPPETGSPEQPPETGSPEQPPETASPEQPVETTSPEPSPETASPEPPVETTSPEPPPEPPPKTAALEQPPETASQEQPPESASPEPSPEETGSETEEDPLRAPDFTVYDRDGNQVRLSDFVGKPVVLNFWASWCGPCKREMPDFNEAHAELGEEIQFLMVNLTTMETQESAAALIDEMGYTFPVFYDLDGDAAVTYRTYSIPTTYFIDAQGRGIAQATGAIDRDTLQRGIDMISGQ